MPALSDWRNWLTPLRRDPDKPPEPDTPLLGQPDHDETEEVVPDNRA